MAQFPYWFCYLLQIEARARSSELPQCISNNVMNPSLHFQLGYSRVDERISGFGIHKLGQSLHYVRVRIYWFLYTV
jgi:hypothetical protein